jgi:hypothetical protein
LGVIKVNCSILLLIFCTLIILLIHTTRILDSQKKKHSSESKLYVLDRARFKASSRLLVVGDVHGDLQTIHSIQKIFDPSEDMIIFLGDYADRGLNGVEVVDTIRSLSDNNPQNVIVLKGNHEDYTDDGEPLFYPCDLVNEAERKKEGGWRKYFLNELQPFLKRLYLAAILPGECLFVHGGISSKIVDIDSMAKATREIETDMLWSDPFEGTGEHPNFRGEGILFGEDVTDTVCKRLGVERIIRSHEPDKSLSGPFYEHDGKVVTISSTRVYGGKPFVLAINTLKPSEAIPQFL